MNIFVNPYCRKRGVVELNEVAKSMIHLECDYLEKVWRKNGGRGRFQKKIQCKKIEARHCNEAVQCVQEIKKYLTEDEKKRLNTCKNEFFDYLNSFTDKTRLEQVKKQFLAFNIVEQPDGEFSDVHCEGSKDNLCTKVKPYYKFMTEKAPVLLSNFKDQDGNC